MSPAGRGGDVRQPVQIIILFGRLHARRAASAEHNLAHQRRIGKVAVCHQNCGAAAKSPFAAKRRWCPSQSAPPPPTRQTSTRVHRHRPVKIREPGRGAAPIAHFSSDDHQPRFGLRQRAHQLKRHLPFLQGFYDPLPAITRIPAARHRNDGPGHGRWGHGPKNRQSQPKSKFLG